MRIYGSSPLYNYVELIFRCKRLFIISIVLGTVIISSFAYTRPTMYESQMLMALAGDAAVAQSSAPELHEAEVQMSPATRKRQYFDRLVGQMPMFLQGVIDDADLRKSHPGKTDTELSNMIRKGLGEVKSLDPFHMQIVISWPNAKEADAILSAIYRRFSERVLFEETRVSDRKAEVARQQYGEAEASFEKAATARIKYQKEHFWNTSPLLTAQMTQADTVQTQLDSNSMDLNEARQRLEEVNRQLPGVKPEIEIENVEQAPGTMDPAIADAAELQSLKQELDQKSQSYSPLHPVIQDLQRRIASAQARLDKDKQHPVQQKMLTSARALHKERNPEFAELMMSKRDLERTVSALARRQDDLRTQLVTKRERVQSMPVEEAAWQRIEDEYNLASNIRTNRRSNMEILKIDADRDRLTKAKEISLDAEPKAEKAETAGKAILLYALGPLLGLVIAFCFSLIAESLDHSLRTPVEVEKYLGKPVLAVLPKVQPAKPDRKRLGGASRTSISS